MALLFFGRVQVMTYTMFPNRSLSSYEHALRSLGGAS